MAKEALFSLSNKALDFFNAIKFDEKLSIGLSKG